MKDSNLSDSYHAMPDEFFWTEGQKKLEAEKQKPESPTSTPPKGRHVFTREECQRGFWAAIDSIISRYPNAIMADGRHMACNFLKAKSMSVS